MWTWAIFGMTHGFGTGTKCEPELTWIWFDLWTWAIFELILGFWGKSCCGYYGHCRSSSSTNQIEFWNWKHFLYFEEKSCCSCYGRYGSSTNQIKSWSLNWTHFFISRKNRAAAAMDATDHPPTKLNLGVWIGHIFLFRWKILLQLLLTLQISHQSNWILEFELDTFFSFWG